LNTSQFVRYAQIPEHPEIDSNEKVAETCEFDGKELLFHETAMGISKIFFFGMNLCGYNTKNKKKLLNINNEYVET